MPNLALIPEASARIPPLAGVIDGYPRVGHRLTTNIGSEPLEDGREVTDHVVALQEVVTLTAWISNFQGGGRSFDAWQVIRRIWDESITFQLITEMGTLPEVVIEDADAEEETGGATVTLKVRHIRRARVEDQTLAAGTTSGTAVGRAGEVARGRVVLGETRF